MVERSYLPALRFHALTGLYDALVAILCREKAFKAALVAQAALRPGQKVLDLGCGTGTLTFALKDACPGASILGVDADAEILECARAKGRDREVRFLHGFAQEIDPGLGPFDRVVTSLFLHHVPAADRKAVLVRVRDGMNQGGVLHIADWDRPANVLQSIGFSLVRALDGWELTRGHAEGRMEEWLRDAGFQDVLRTRRFLTPIGTISLWKAAATTPDHTNKPALRSH